MAAVLRADLERGGVHLDAAGRRAASALQNEAAALQAGPPWPCHSFRVDPSESLFRFALQRNSSELIF